MHDNTDLIHQDISPAKHENEPDKHFKRHHPN